MLVVMPGWNNKLTALPYPHRQHSLTSYLKNRECIAEKSIRYIRMASTIQAYAVPLHNI